jgi:hypothetical protein
LRLFVPQTSRIHFVVIIVFVLEADKVNLSDQKKDLESHFSQVIMLNTFQELVVLLEPILLVNYLLLQDFQHQYLVQLH